MVEHNIIRKQILRHLYCSILYTKTTKSVHFFLNSSSMHLQMVFSWMKEVPS